MFCFVTASDSVSCKEGGELTLVEVDGARSELADHAAQLAVKLVFDRIVRSEDVEV